MLWLKAWNGPALETSGLQEERAQLCFFRFTIYTIDYALKLQKRQAWQGRAMTIC